MGRIAAGQVSTHLSRSDITEGFPKAVVNSALE